MMLAWWVPGMLLAGTYSYVIYTRLPGTFRTGEDPH
jgi:hypothetical protein